MPGRNRRMKKRNTKSQDYKYPMTLSDNISDAVGKSVSSSLSEKVPKKGVVMEGVLYLKSEPTAKVNSEKHRSSRIRLESYVKSNLPNKRAGDVIEMIWRNHGAKPFIGWYDGATDPANPAIKAWMGAHDLANNPNSAPHNHWSVEVSDSSGQMQTRFSIPFDKDHTNIKTSSADFTVGYGILRVGGDGNRDIEFAESTTGKTDDARFTLRLDSNNNFRIISRDDNGKSIGASPFVIERLSAFVGIGTRRPKRKLHVRHHSQAVMVEGTNSSSFPLIAIQQPAENDKALGVRKEDDIEYRFVINTDGKIALGDGNSSLDVDLFYENTFKALGTNNDMVFKGQTGPIIQDVQGNYYRIAINLDGTLKTIKL